jgi:hypothetical protein
LTFSDGGNTLSALKEFVTAEGFLTSSASHPTLTGARF